MAGYVEFSLVANAFYIDPSDQSAWMYHRWLLGRGRLAECMVVTSYQASSAAEKQNSICAVAHVHDAGKAMSTLIVAFSQPIVVCGIIKNTKGH